MIFKTDTVKSTQYCGKVNSIRDPDDDEETEERFTYAHNAFVDEKGQLDVTISVAGQRLLQSQKLDIAITFTAYKSRYLLGLIWQLNTTILSSIIIFHNFIL